MNTKHQSPAQAGSIYEVSADPEVQTETDGNNNTFSLVDSAEMKLLPLMSPAATDDAAILYIEKGEITLMYDMKTYILSKGTLFYKVPQVPLGLLSFSEDCHFKAFCFASEFTTDSNMPAKHLETVTKIASNNPVIIPDTLTAAAVTVLFWLLQKKISWGEKTESPDETIQHVFTLLLLEIISSHKRNMTAKNEILQINHLSL